MKGCLRSILAAAFVLVVGMVRAATFTFDFDNGPFHSSTPFDQMADGLNAHFSATAAGFSLQPANTMGFTPVGFSGYCIYPNSVYLSDLTISFSQSLTSASILYAPHELATDSSCTMRITAYLNGVLIGTATHTNPNPGTWPTDTLAFSSPEAFNQIVVHYDQPPITGGDYGPIFMADHLVVDTVPEPASASLLWLGVTALATLRRSHRMPSRVGGG